MSRILAYTGDGRRTQMKVWISGIVHGSRMDGGLHGQEYRERIRQALAVRYHDVVLASPGTVEAGAAEDEEAVFFRQIGEVIAADVLVAYLPEASMGASIEMWEAWKNSRPIITISPLSGAWTVRFLSSLVVPDLDSFEARVADGSLDRFLLDRYERPRQSR